MYSHLWTFYYDLCLKWLLSQLIFVSHGTFVHDVVTHTAKIFG